MCTAAASITCGVSVGCVISVTSGSGSCLLFNTTSGSGWWILAATRSILAASKAPKGKRLSSCQSALVIIIVPASSKLNSTGKIPTDKLSKTPSFASCNASSPARVSLMRASNNTVSPTCSRLSTMPMGWVLSW